MKDIRLYKSKQWPTTIAMILVYSAFLLVNYATDLGINDEKWLDIILLLLTFCFGVFGNYIWSSQDNTKFMTFERLSNLVSGCEVAGLDRIEPTLKQGTRVEDASQSAITSIKFIGVAGSKFLASLLDARTGIGRRLESGSVSLQVLLLNPDGNQISRWTPSPAKRKKVQDDIRRSISIIDKFNGHNVEYKLYDFLPPLRMVIVDDITVLVSRYDPGSQDGWDAPQMCFSNRDNNNAVEFCHGFRDLYNFMWNTTK